MVTSGLVVNVLGIFGMDELFSKLRQVCLMGQPDEFVYKESILTLEQEAPLAQVHIPQNYVLRSNLDNILGLWFCLKLKGIDIFALEGYVKIEVVDENGEKIIRDVLPPIVEFSGDYGGIRLLNDGMHRLYLPWLMRRTINYVFISGASHPYYAFPFDGSLADVQIITGGTKPDGFDGKTYRLPGKEYRKLFRDFNSVFENVTLSRRK